MQIRRKSTLRNIAFQIVLIIVLATIATHLVEMIGYKGWLNVFSFFFIVFGVSILYNKSLGEKVFMFILLCLIGLLIVGLNGFLFGYMD